MNILDENILLSQRDQLRARKVHFRQIGMEIGRSGMKDRNDIIPLLHTLYRPTFFSTSAFRLLPFDFCLLPFVF